MSSGGCAERFRPKPPIDSKWHFRFWRFVWERSSPQRKRRNDSIRNELARRLLDLRLARQKFFLERRRIGHRRIERADDPDRCVEKFKGFFLGDRRDGLADRPAARVFVNDHHAAAAACEAENGFTIEWHKAAQIEDSGFDAVLG